MATMQTQQAGILEAPDLSRLHASYADQWVALSIDYSQVLASAENLSSLLQKLSEKDKASEPVFYKVPSKHSYYIPVVQ
jgi:hypothetical protein